MDQHDLVMAATASGIDFEKGVLANSLHTVALIAGVASPGNWAMTADAYSGVRLCKEPTIDDNYQP